MELLEYLRIARRWWWLIALPAVVVAAFGLATYRAPAAAYAGSVRYTASQPPAVAAGQGYDPNYYAWLTSEYIVTALKDWVKTNEFAQAVSAELAARGQPVDPGALGGALTTDNARSILVVSVTWGDAAQVPAILEAVTAVLQTQNASAFPQLGGLAAEVEPLDAPTVAPVGPGLRARLDLPLKLAVALAAGVGLALLAHYLDPYVRDRRELEALGWPVVGEIPPR